MAPKNKFSKEQIIDIAFNIGETEGIENITVRKVAEILGSSVAPIYVNFKDGKELLQAVIDKTRAIAISMTKEEYTDMPFLNMGIGTLRFAREYSVLFKDMVIKNIDCVEDDRDSKVQMLEQMKRDKTLQGFTDEELQQILFKMSVFTHGLSIMVANNLFSQNYNEKELFELLEDTGKDIIMATRLKKEGGNICI
ncbi:MAG: TetR/AcrR family transcriptional regulator [Clostridiaceae bacterium]|nr:TetR/AcrR family transcriptional regulator [Clostridiaceae bacterium]